MTSGLPDPGENQDLTADIFATTEYIAERPPHARPFLPWHKPRKHYVRRQQWAHLTHQLYDGSPSTRPLRYLGLPGVDLMDLRYLHEAVCKPAGRPFQFLGFNKVLRHKSAEQADLDVTLDEVRRLPGVEPTSTVLPDEFERIAEPNSIAWVRAQELGPFDVVNIDLCDGIASHAPDRQPSLYNAIAAVVGLQIRNPTPWLLLLTTRVGRGHFNSEAQSLLLQLIDRNVDECAAFSSAFGDHFGLDWSQVDIRSCEDLAYFQVMVTAICKWLMGLMQGDAPSHVTLSSSQSYRVFDGALCNDLVSLAIHVAPLIAPRPDRSGLATHPQSEADECASAAAMVPSVAATIDVDAAILADGALRANLIAEMEHLLQVARYGVGRYRDWLEEL